MSHHVTPVLFAKLLKTRPFLSVTRPHYLSTSSRLRPATQSPLTKPQRQTTRALSSRTSHVEDDTANADTTTASGEPASPDKAEVDRQKVLSSQAEKITELTDLYRRAIAEQENIRQRSKRENSAASTFAINKFASDLLTVADTLELALANTKATSEVTSENTSIVGKAENLENLRKGVDLTLKTLSGVLAKHGVTAFDASKQPFDFNTMNAIFEVPASQDCPAGHVFQVVKKGYMLNGRVLRAAQVGVTKTE